MSRKKSNLKTPQRNDFDDSDDEGDIDVFSSMGRLSVRKSFGTPDKFLGAGGPSNRSKMAAAANGDFDDEEGGGGGGGGKEKKEKVKKLEPKVFFANERTFLQWVNSSITLVTLGVALISFSGNNNRFAFTSGLVFSVIAVVFMLYAVVIFRWRARRLKAVRQGPYDDNLGPPILVASMIAAIATTFVLFFLTDTGTVDETDDI